MMENYITTSDVNEIINNLDRLAAFKCLGRISDDISRYEQDLILYYKQNGEIKNDR